LSTRSGFLVAPVPEFGIWTAWYNQYIKSAIFKSRGYVGDQSPSTRFHKYFNKGNVEYVGQVERFAKNSSREIVNRTFYDFLKLKSIKLPSQYRKTFSNIDAEYISAAKYDKGQPLLDDGAWILAGEWTKNHFMKWMSGSCVLPKDDVLVEMTKTTSAGYPWSREFFTKNEMLKDEQASGVLDGYWDLIGSDNLDNIVPIWTCSQKMEMRHIDKLAKNSLRTFTACPFELSVATNRLCLDANNRFYKSANESFSCVGMSKFLSGWDSVYKRLSRLPHAFELDESEYDSSLFAKALYGQRDIRWSFLKVEEQTDANWLRLCAIYDTIVRSVIVMDTGELIRKHTGNPSGSSNTVVDNTMILFRLFAYAWIVLCKELESHEYLDYWQFIANVEAALYGDDNTYTCSENVVGWFHPTNISRVWTSIGVTTKTPDYNPRKLGDVSFLSNGFHYSEKDRMWFPVPETERVLCSLLFGSDIDDVRFHLLRAYALRLDSYYNKEVRDILRGYTEFLMEHHANQMHGVVEIGENTVSMKEIMAVWKSDDWIEALYSGKEGSSEYFSIFDLLYI